MSKTIKILIADDHTMIRTGVRMMLESQDKIPFNIYEVSDGNEVLKVYKSKKIDIVLMDINMKYQNGITATKDVKKYDPGAKIIILSMYSELHFIESSIKAGALGYILKDSGQEELIKAIKIVFFGEQYLSNDVGLKLLRQQNNKRKDIFNKDKAIKITDKEFNVLNLVAQEFTNEEIAKQLNISKRTVEAHRTKMLNRLGLKNTAGLIRYAVKNGLVD